MIMAEIPLYEKSDGTKHLVTVYRDVDDNGKFSYRMYLDDEYWSGGESVRSIDDDLDDVKEVYHLSDSPLCLYF